MQTLQGRAAETHSVSRGAATRVIGLVVALALLALTVVLSLMVGARGLAPDVVIGALVNFDGSDAHVIVRDSRLPRTIVGLIVGPALGVCGALIQAYTRNPLADPGILGVNAGSTLAVTIGVSLLGISSPGVYVWWSFLGAFVVTVVVYIIGSSGPSGATPERMTLAGVALGAVLAGIASVIMIKDVNVFRALQFWGLGSLGGRDYDALAVITPFIVVGLVTALLISRSLNAIALGDDLGRTLGAGLMRTRIIAILAVTLLAGAATAIAGPIAFVGLMVPHAVRWFTGPDQRWIIVFSAIVAPILLLVSDVIGRVILPTGELQVSIVTAVLGAPVLILLARRRKVSGL